VCAISRLTHKACEIIKKTHNIKNMTNKKALIIGANGTIAKALEASISGEYGVSKVSRANCDYSELGLSSIAESLKKAEPFQLIINTIGVLHDDVVVPEKRLSQLSADKLAHYFYVNTILPSLCIKYFHGLLDKTHTSVYVNLSAMVGSIEDNRTGGWYGYRSSKAALNMMVKTASVELHRVNPKACLVCMHPGTTKGSLSRPYASNVADDRYYTSAQSAERIMHVVAQLNASQTGQFFNWDGKPIPW